MSCTLSQNVNARALTLESRRASRARARSVASGVAAATVAVERFVLAKAVPKPGPLYGTHSGGEGTVTALFVMGFSFFFPFAFPGFPFLGFPLKHERGSGLHRCACRHGLLLVACPLVGLFSRSIPPPLEDYGAPAPTLEQTGGGLVNIHAKRCFSWRHLSRTAIVPLIHSIRLVL